MEAMKCQLCGLPRIGGLVCGLCGVVTTRHDEMEYLVSWSWAKCFGKNTKRRCVCVDYYDDDEEEDSVNFI